MFNCPSRDFFCRKKYATSDFSQISNFQGCLTPRLQAAANLQQNLFLLIFKHIFIIF